jgi:beta-glucosidase
VSHSPPASDLSRVDDDGHRRVEPGRVRISVGGSQPDSRSAELTGTSPLSVEIDVQGAPVDIDFNDAG